ncbi:molybdopterin molybdotransferase MoeA [Kaarinaea lacus]
MSDDIVISQPSCADAVDSTALPVAEAIQRINALVDIVKDTELVPIREALERTLASDILSSINVPSHTNSAVDGYAIAAGDLAKDTSKQLTVVGTTFAGQPYKERIQPGQCVRIMTGAKMPAGTDTVIMQEHVLLEGDVIRFGPGHTVSEYVTGQNVRHAGEDLKIGQVAIHAGKKLTPAELGMLASMGMDEVKVCRKLRVTFFSTGNELRSLGEPLKEGEIYDSNRYTLHGMLSRLQVEINDMGVIPDQPDVMREAFLTASSNADVVITTGGVSVGEADFVKDIIAEIGKVDFWKLAIKPGRPLAFGKINDAIFFGLPGNPVAVMVTFYQFVQPTLRRMMGQTDINQTRFKVTCESSLKKKPGRIEYYRGILSTDNDGQVTVRKAGMQGSGILSIMSKANCFIVLAADQHAVEPGQLVNVQPFEGLI